MKKPFAVFVVLDMHEEKMGRSLQATFAVFCHIYGTLNNHKTFCQDKINSYF